MSLQVSSVRNLRAGNIVDRGAGALITATGVDPSVRISTAAVARRLTAFPWTFRWATSPAELTQAMAWLRLTEALAEQACLLPRPARVLRESETTVVIWLPVDDASAAEAAANLACHILAELQCGALDNSEASRLWSALLMRFWNQTHALLARAAQQNQIPFLRFHQGAQELLQLGQGSRLRLCLETLSDRTPLFARQAADKEAMHSLLQGRGVPLPVQAVVESLDQALAAAARIGWPVVLKPVSGSKGSGVWVGIANPEQMRQAWQQGGAQGKQLVQQMLSGADHRLLVINGRLLAAAQRQPALLISDGARPLSEQISAFNADPDRGVAYERLRNRVPVDARLSQLLQEQGWSMAAVPPRGTRVQLSRTANISQGGSAIDCSDRIHPDNRRLAEDIAVLIGSDVLGLDFISKDLGVSWRQGGTWLLEANLSAGLRPHLVANPQTDLCQRIVRQWVGDGPRAGRIPTALVTGSIGKTTTSRMLAHLLQGSGLRVGLTSTYGMELDGQVILAGDLAGGAAAQRLLQDRRVEAMVAEIARGGLLKYGLGLEAVDVAAVLNVLDNHIGVDGIRSRGELARIKGIVAQAAEHLVVLNADDPLVLAMAEGRPPQQLALVAEEPGHAAWQAHRRAGHPAALYSMLPGGRIQLFLGGDTRLEVSLQEIPASDGGAVGPIAPAAAFAALLAHGMGLELSSIREGLLSFGLQPHHCKGRFEILMRQPWEVVLTWADGPDAMAAVSRYVQARTATQGRRRILLCSAPDNRPDAFLHRVGEATWGFDLVICAAWERRRGRDPAEVPALLAAGARRLGPDGPEVVEAGLDSEALALLAERLQPGDLCVVTSFETDQARRALLRSLARGSAPV